MSLTLISEIIAKTANCNINEVSPETNLLSLGLTSLDTLTILFDIEEAFDIEIPNEIIPSIKTVGDILNKLEDLPK